MKLDHSLIRPLLLLDYLQKNTSENAPKATVDVRAEIEQNYGLILDRHTIGRIIDELNTALYVIENNVLMDEAEEWARSCNQEELYIVKSRKGIYCQQHIGGYTANDIRLIAECIYSARFIPEKQTENLVDIVCGLISNKEAQRIKHKTPTLISTRKTLNQEVFHNLETINRALERATNPIRRKISFIYTRTNKDNPMQQTARRNGERYVANPYHLLVNDGNYYLLCYEENLENERIIKTYRVDRMKDVRITDEPIAGRREMYRFDFNEYAQSMFGMFDGPEENVCIQFNNSLFDAMTDRFGRRNGVIFAKIDDEQMTLTTKIRISNQFFGWVLGFGTNVKITSPERVKEQFIKYLQQIQNVYE